METAVKSPSVLMPGKMWDRLGSVSNPSDLASKDAVVLVGWMFPQVAKHWLVTRIDLGMYHGITVDRSESKIGRFSGLLGDPYGLMGLLQQGVEVDKACGICKFTIKDVFKRMQWNKGMLR